jgi:hypothetical protein
MSEAEKAKSVKWWDDFAKRCEAPPPETSEKPKPKKKGK